MGLQRKTFQLLNVAEHLAALARLSLHLLLLLLLLEGKTRIISWRGFFCLVWSPTHSPSHLRDVSPTDTAGREANALRNCFQMSCGQAGWRASAASAASPVLRLSPHPGAGRPQPVAALAVVTQTGRLSRKLHQQMSGNGLTQRRDLGPTECLKV